MLLEMRLLHVFLDYFLELAVRGAFEILLYVKLETPSMVRMVFLEVFAQMIFHPLDRDIYSLAFLTCKIVINK